MPLTSKWWLSKKKGKEVWAEPKINSEKVISYSIHHGLPDHTQKKDVELGTSFSNAQGKKTKATFTCVVCGIGVAEGDYIDSEDNSGRMNCTPIAVVVEGKQSRAYLPVDDQQMKVLSEQAVHYLSHPVLQEKIPMEPARGTFASNAQGRIYGFKVFSSYFTARQLVTLITFCLLIDDVKAKVVSDTNIAGLSSDKVYADAVMTYLALAIDRLADRSSTICSWDTKVRNTFARQAISMTWDFAEANPFSESTGNFFGAIDWIAQVLQEATCDIQGKVVQRDATMLVHEIRQPLISTDPPYYDNVSYADLSDFFYVWLCRALKSIYPELFSTMLVPKAQELVATPYRFNGSKGEAQKFFETGLQKAFEQMRAVQSPDYSLTVYYAFKQAESETETNGEEGGSEKGIKVTASTGWETMLKGLIQSGFAITGTWPMRTELANRTVGLGNNALASSIALVCRPRAHCLAPPIPECVETRTAPSPQANAAW